MSVFFDAIRLAWNALKNGQISSKDLNNLLNGHSTNPVDYVADNQKADALTNADVAAGLDNALTGNLDYQRSLAQLMQEQSFSAAEAAKTRDFNAEQAEIARQWEERMSNSSYQRQAADLAAAGFNPALVLNGSGASTPVVSAASAVNPASPSASSPRLGSKAANLILSAVELMSGMAQSNARIAANNEKIKNELYAAVRRLDASQEYNKVLAERNSLNSEKIGLAYDRFYQEFDNPKKAASDYSSSAVYSADKSLHRYNNR